MEHRTSRTDRDQREFVSGPTPFALSEVDGPALCRGLRLRSARTDGDITRHACPARSGAALAACGRSW
ncbi:MAG: hypothetical protein EOP67_75780 [Sphingomonas sp.]|nr:MAG: hypothetical protein EOP67_75780 [Sphingomonas sp.]